VAFAPACRSLWPCCCEFFAIFTATPIVLNSAGPRLRLYVAGFALATARPWSGHLAWLGPWQDCHGPPGAAYRRGRHGVGRLYSGRCITAYCFCLIIRQLDRC
jgi:hypothetical protein